MIFWGVHVPEHYPSLLMARTISSPVLDVLETRGRRMMGHKLWIPSHPPSLIGGISLYGDRDLVLSQKSYDLRGRVSSFL